MEDFHNPFRPGAGHMPPYLAGREAEKKEFARLLEQSTVLQNMVLTGLRGVGKTVLLETFKPTAMEAHWWWVGTDLSESSSITEAHLVTRILADLSVVTSSLSVPATDVRRIGFVESRRDVPRNLTFQMFHEVYRAVPGLASDKLKAILTLVRHAMPPQVRGIVFAYDEAQNLADHAAEREYPLSLLLDTFQSIQRMGFPFLLALVGLPTLFPTLVEARTFAERMFRVLFLSRLNDTDSKDAIVKPIKDAKCPVKLSGRIVGDTVEMSGGYPYFIQFICREVYDTAIQKNRAGEDLIIPMREIQRKLDSDFFAGRWARATDRQRDLLSVVARLPNADAEFTVQEVVRGSKRGPGKGFSPSHANQMLAVLTESGLVYKNRHGKYSFAVPLMGKFITRQTTTASAA